MPKVVFPCDLDNWWRVKDDLHSLKEDCLKGQITINEVAVKHNQIWEKNLGILESPAVEWEETVFSGLVKYFNRHADHEETVTFLQITFPSIIDLVLDIEAHLPTDGIDIIEQQKGESREISRELCCSIVACGFLCLFPDDNRGWKTKLNQINFTRFFTYLGIPSQNAKLKCILHFIDRVAADRKRLNGVVTFTRQVIKAEELPTVDTWLNCNWQLCEITVHHEGVIEDAVPQAVEVDFANRYIGGGVLNRGRVQEEIRFCACPELLVGLLLLEVMEDNEAIIIQGYEQFSAIQGYGSDLKYAGDFQDQCQVDDYGNKPTMLCAIDAVSYKHDRHKQPGKQYQDHSVLRDLNKAFTGFCVPFTLPSTEIVCKSSDDSYMTASTSEPLTNGLDIDLEEGQANTFHSQVSNFVDHLLLGAMNLAFTDATKAISCSEELLDMPSYGGDHILQRQSSMDHLEVNFRDWYSNYRRRSSNLSDLSSRRSSYDLASRRSSACSARGYSSEYSSEFEEYYDNFQQDQKYKYHTIKEEVGSTPIIEFASCLAASLLQEGTREASSSCNVLSEFNSELPSYDIQRPLPIRISTTSLSTVESVENEDAIVHEDCVRQYVDDMFDSIWPFNEESSEERIVDEIQKNFLEELNENRAMFEEKIDLKSNQSAESTELDDVVGEPYIVDEMVLTAVADHLVGVAFQEALLEYRYIMNESSKLKGNSFSSVSESGQSDHSIDLKDQSDSSSNSKPSHHQAVKVAEKVMTSLFSGNNFRVDETFSPHCERVPDNSNIPKPDACDTNLMVVDNQDTYSNTSQNSHQSQHSKHSDAMDDNEGSLSDKEVHICVEGIDLDTSLTAKSIDNHSVNNSSFQSTNSDSASISDEAGGSVNTSLSDKLGVNMSGASGKVESKFDSKADCVSCRSISSDNDNQVIIVSPPRKVDRPERQRTSSLLSQKSSDSGERRCNIQTWIQSSESGCQEVAAQSTGSLTSQTGSKRPLSAGSKSNNKLMPPGHSQGRLKHVYMTGNRKNYDQFANSLSRDLLTNAFLQVQEHSEPVVYPRRSSEPMQISNGAALQRFEHTVNSVNGRHGIKSKTDEDISQCEDEWLQQFSGRSSSGFRDPVLSRFAEELMKVNVSVPPLQLPVAGDCVSVSGSSHSVCSTMSSFRDPLLASFEEELLSVKSSGAKTQMSWSKMKGSMCSPRPDCNSNSSSSHESKKQMGVSLSVDSETSGLSWRSSKSNMSPFSLTVSEYADILSLRIVCEALTVVSNSELKSTDINEQGDSSTCCRPVVLDLYCNMLAWKILASSMETAVMLGSDWLEQNKVVTWSDETECVHYSEEDNLESSDLDISRERLPSCSESRSSMEYEDALDIPYQRLEEFADILASKVLINSVAISRRENLCSIRRQYGRPIATGNWGCGAFGGDPHLKSLIQWMAASYAGCPQLMYYTFRSPQLERFEEVIFTVQERGWDVSRLMQVVRRYCITARQEIQDQGFVSRPLFDVILQGEIFPGL